MKNDSRKKLIDPRGGDVPQDEELVKLALHGDRSALERLAERYQDRVYNLSLRNIFRELPFYRSPAGDALVKRLLDRPEIKRIINFEAGARHE